MPIVPDTFGRDPRSIPLENTAAKAEIFGALPGLGPVRNANELVVVSKYEMGRARLLPGRAPGLTR